METGVGFINLDDSVKIALNIALAVARENANECYTPSHLLKALLHKDVGLRDFIISIGKDLGYLEEWADVYIEQCPKSTQLSEIKPSERIDAVFRAADDARIQFGLFDINPICVLLALAKPGVAFSSDQLRSFPILEKDIHSIYIGNGQPACPSATTEKSYAPTSASSSFLGKYCVDLTEDAANKLHPVINRDRENRMVMEILGSRSKSNVLIVGDAGVGKTALVYGLAWEIVSHKVPSFLEETRVFELDNASLIAGATYKGEIEDRLKNILKELRNIDNAILFIDEIHVLLDNRQGNTGAGNVLKSELSHGDLTVIGATTIDEYRKIIEPDHAFSRRFEVIQVSEPDIKSAIQMLHSVQKQYVDYHHVRISNEAVAECVRLAKRYIKDRRLPDSAIGLLDMTLSAIKMVNETGKKNVETLLSGLDEIEKDEKDLQEKTEELKTLLFVMHNKLSPILLGVIPDEADIHELQEYEELTGYLRNALNVLLQFAEKKIEEVGIYEVAAVVASKTGIPIGKIQSQEKERLLNMEDYLRRRVVGQDQALKTLTDAILESRSGMNKPPRIIGHLVIFWECNSYIEIFVNLVACNLFFKARDELTAAQLQLEVFALAAFKRRIAKEAFKVEGHFVAHFCCTVVHRNHLCISLANVFSLLCNIFICDFLVFLRSSHALVVSDVDFRLGHANNLYGCTVFLANRSHFYLRSIDQIQSSFCNDTRHFHIQNQVQSIFKENAFAIRSFTQSSRNFALPETRQRNVLLLLLINGFNCLFKSFCINSSDQFGHVDICFFR